jgi:cohesin complex subunit SA-1/2
VKAPSKFAPDQSGAAASKRKRGDGDEEDAENGVSDDEDDMSVDSDAESDADHPAPRSRKQGQGSRARKPSSKKPKTNGVQSSSLGRAHVIPSRPKKSVRIDAGHKGTGLFGRLSPSLIEYMTCDYEG